MNLNTREQLITLGVALAALLTFVFGLALPRSKALADARRKNTQLHKLNQNLARENATIPSEHQEVERLKQELKIARSRVPLEDHFAEYENSLLRLGEEFDLWDQTTEPQIIDSTPSANYAENRINTRRMKLKFTAEFGKFYDFVRALESQTRLTRIERIEINPVDEYGNLFTIELELSIFHGRL